MKEKQGSNRCRGMMAANLRLRVTAALAGAAAFLTACASEPAYFGPLSQGHSTGYTDQQIDQNRFRVTYQGNSATPRETVEDFLVLRSAQIAVQAGYPYFMFDTRDTKAKTMYFSTFDNWPGWGYRRWGWYGWGGPPFDEGDAVTRPVTRYEAYAEIVLLTEAQAHNDPRALNAQSVIGHLSPLVAPTPPVASPH